MWHKLFADIKKDHAKIIKIIKFLIHGRESSSHVHSTIHCKNRSLKIGKLHFFLFKFSNFLQKKSQIFVYKLSLFVREPCDCSDE